MRVRRVAGVVAAVVLLGGVAAGAAPGTGPWARLAAQVDRPDEEPKFSMRAGRLRREPGDENEAPAEQNRRVGMSPDRPGSFLRDGDRRPVFYLRVKDTGPAAVQSLADQGARVLHVSPRYRQVTAAIPPPRLAAVAGLDNVEFVMEAIAPVTARRGLGGGRDDVTVARPVTGGELGGGPDDVTVARPVAGRRLAGGRDDLTVARPVGGGAARAGGGSVLAAGSCNTPNTEGDAQLSADAARAAFGVDGAGVPVGVLSDSYDMAAEATTHAAGDVSSGNLPGVGNPCGYTTPVGVLAEAAAGIDEGRAMLQIVHDLAPGATLMFATGFGGIYAMADNIVALAAAGADVIVDDLAYLAEPFFQDGPITNAVAEVRRAGVSYFSSAGNQTLVDAGHDWNGYEAPAYRPMPCPAGVPGFETSCHNFNPSGPADATYGFTVAPGKTVTIDLQWAEPWSGVATNLDAFLLQGSSIVDDALDNNPTGTGVPFEFVGYQNTTGVPVILDLVIGHRAGPGPRLKTIFFGSGAVIEVEHGVPAAPDAVTGTIFGHNGGADAISVAASRYNDIVNPEPFSSKGPVTLYFGPVDGSTPAPALTPPAVIAKPDLTATDGGLTTFFSAPGNRFFGTSAAAPHAAAVATLLRQRRPTITPGSMIEVLTATATAMAGGAPLVTGAGLVNALAAGDILSLPPPGFNGVIDQARASGDAGTYGLMQQLSNLYNGSRGCSLDQENVSVCRAIQP